ncbi:hypothetical protein Syun_030498 [Stephania yunnanensis]|uniref:Uncharacterized protein n=1 Tax=Stephania yunnanensis TaxID=152371 RepID=A0AAP0EFW9_9MAGN
MNISREIINNTERECGVQLSNMGQKLNREGPGGEDINPLFTVERGNMLFGS